MSEAKRYDRALVEDLGRALLGDDSADCGGPALALLALEYLDDRGLLVVNQVHRCAPPDHLEPGWTWMCTICNRSVEAPVRWVDIASEPRRRWWRR